MQENILLVPGAEKNLSYTMTMNTIQIMDAVARSAITRFLAKDQVEAGKSMTALLVKTTFKGMQYPVFVIITDLSIFYLNENSFRNISLILRTMFDIKVSHTSISNWCTNFVPMFDNLRIQLLPLLDFNSNEQHADKTVVKIAGMNHHLWFVVDAITRFIVFYLLTHRTARKPPRFSPRHPNLAIPSLLFLTVTASTRCLPNPSSQIPLISVCKAIKMIYPTISFACLFSSSTLSFCILLYSASLLLKLLALIFQTNKKGSFFLWLDWHFCRGFLFILSSQSHLFQSNCRCQTTPVTFSQLVQPSNL